MLTVVQSKEEPKMAAFVTVEGDSYVEVTGPEARKLAIKHAAGRGHPRCGISGSTGPFIVDIDGKMIDPSKYVEIALDTNKKFLFRNTYTVNSGIGT